MARKQSSLLEDVTDLAAHLHWGISLALALTSFLIVHAFAGPAPAETVTDPGQVVNMMTASLIRMGASILQYVAPLPFIAGAVLSFIRRRRQGELHAKVASDPSTDALEKMSWLDFENLVAETFRQKGYRVVERGGAGPDGGVDQVVYQGDDKYLVQCKQWKTRQVGVAIVRELYGVMTATRAVGGFIVASGEFTADAKEFARGRSIELIDARKLRRMIQGAGPAAPAVPEKAPLCPKCGGRMVARRATTGPNAGNQFWGCARYPGCKGIRNG